MSSKFIALILFFFSTLHGATSPVLKPFESVEAHMGTLFRIKLYAADQKIAEAGFAAAYARVAQLDNALSDYKPDSELNLATKAAALQPVHISDDLATVLKASQQMSIDTDGAFDVTVGPLTKLWRSARKQNQMPSAEAIRAAHEKCGYQRLHLDAAAQTMKVDFSDMQLDLGAIAKGYAADQALLVLENLGIHAALVAASGDLAFGDAPPDQPGWKIGVDSFDRADKPFTRVLMLKNAAVGTSGATEQYLEANHQRYSHIIDPKTGMGLVTGISVTIIARHGITADAVGTAVSVLGSEKGLAFVEKHAEVAAFILDRADGQVHAIESSRFKDLIK